MVKIKMKGVKEVQQALLALNGKFLEAVAAALLAGGLVVVTDARRRAPYVTGDLMRSIKPKPDSVAVLADQLKHMSRAELLIVVGVPYGRIQEYLGKKGPYLRPALQENKTKVRNEIRKALRQVVNAAGGR